MGSTRLVSRNVSARHGRTSIRLEPEFWEALQKICWREQMELGELIRSIELKYPGVARTSAVRVYILTYFADAATEEGHWTAGHGSPLDPRLGRQLTNPRQKTRHSFGR